MPTRQGHVHIVSSQVKAMILWAMTALMACRLAQPAHLSNTH